MDFSKEVSTLFGVGAAQSKKFSRLGIETIKDLIYHFPRTYRDLSKPQKITELRSDEEGIIEARVLDISSHRTFRRRLNITSALVEDDSGTLPLVWFNQPFLTRVLRQGETFIFYGKLMRERRTGSLQMASPQYEKFPKIIPIYSETEGLTSKQIRLILSAVLPEVREMDDPLPPVITKKYHLMPLGMALWNIHEPSDQKLLNCARRRLAFDELFSVVSHFIKFERDLGQRQAPAIGINKKLLGDFVKKLPFKLTQDQRLAAWKIIKHMAENHVDSRFKIPPYAKATAGRQDSRVKLPVTCHLSLVHPLNALLNGDVGSGKTVVALLASLSVINTGYNVVWLAPTSILASQHFNLVKSLTKDLNIPIELVTAATDLRKKLSFRAKSTRLDSQSLVDARRGNPLNKNEKRDPRLNDKVGQASVTVGMTDSPDELYKLDEPDELNYSHSSALLIGTHALLHRKDQIGNIGLLVVDEQHRFGVEQRRELISQNDNVTPHFLSMTATPIPRSLAMLFSGLTQLITIKEKPKERKPIITKIVIPPNRQEMYKFIDRELTKGRQAFIITPLIEPSKRGAVSLFGSEKKAVEKEYQKLQKTVFSHRKIGLLHGKLKQNEKDKIMKQMLDREIDILVATSVVEVGIDIPNATVMLIENADSFGLAQLHQFRGRVGRAHHQSYCLLAVSDDVADRPKAVERLKIMVQTNDGFIIAQKDLELRGPGSISGLDQSGFFDFKLANLGDTELLGQAKEAAEEVYNKDKDSS